MGKNRYVKVSEEDRKKLSKIWKTGTSSQERNRTHAIIVIATTCSDSQYKSDIEVE